MTKPIPYYRVAKIAQKYGIPKQTLDSAVKSGRIPSRETECGLPLVREKDVLEWCRNRRGHKLGGDGK